VGLVVTYMGRAMKDHIICNHDWLEVSPYWHSAEVSL